jgi:hypothetical protein
VVLLGVVKGIPPHERKQRNGGKTRGQAGI